MVATVSHDFFMLSYIEDFLLLVSYQVGSVGFCLGGLIKKLFLAADAVLGHASRLTEACI